MFVHQEQVDRDVRRITFTVLVQCILQSLARLSRKHSIHFAQITSNLVVVVYHSFQAPRASTVAFVALLGLLAMRALGLPLNAIRFTEPRVSVTTPGVANSYTLALTSAAVLGPSRARRYETRPATAGEAMEVPVVLHSAVSLRQDAETMFVPTAKISTSGP